MKYDQQIREVFMGGFHEAFELGLGDAKSEISEKALEDLFQETVKEYGGFEQMDRDIDIGVQNGYSVEEQLAILKSILNGIRLIGESKS